MISFKTVRSDDLIFEKMYELYSNSFPIYEQRLLNDQIGVMEEAAYRCDGIYDDERFVGIVFYWVNGDYSYVEHYAISSEERGNNIGSRALTAFGKIYKKVILEIDPPIDEVSIRREGFYSRLGFKKNSFKHFHPPYRLGYKSHELLLLSLPSAIEEAEYFDFKSYLENTIMKYVE